MESTGVLYVYQGEWGLSSIDFECLRALCIVKFTGFPIKIETNSNLLHAGCLPYIKINNNRIIGYALIKKFLDNQGYSIDNHLKNGSKQLSSTYTNWVFTNLHAYFFYYLFGEPDNAERTRMLYAKRTPFPLNFYYPITYQREAKDILQVMAGFDIHDKIENHASDYLEMNAKRCINVLSKKLDGKIWFFGDHFSEFDVTVYAYLAILNRIALPKNPIQNHLKACKNLVNFIDRISNEIFKDEAFNSSKIDSSNPVVTPTEHRIIKSDTIRNILAALGAIAVMGAYASWRVLFSSNPLQTEFNAQLTSFYNNAFGV